MSKFEWDSENVEINEWFGDWENIFEIKWEFLRANMKMSEQMFVVVVFFSYRLTDRERKNAWVRMSVFVNDSAR